MNNYNCEVVADSLNAFGNRITTFKLTYPRIVHAELMTHRVFSRNAASSRAIPVKKMIKFVKNNMFTPLAIQKSHKGMQGSDYFEGVELEQAKQLWIESAELALQQAEKMEKFGITKQLINRILEPYQYYQVLVTATEWDNFFELRCPQYLQGFEFYNSKKDAIKASKDGKDNSGRLYSEYSDINWFLESVSGAEIHIQTLAESMWDAMNESIPKQLEAGEWHIPFGDRFDNDGVKFVKYLNSIWKNKQAPTNGNTNEKIKIATARAARLSYMNFDGEIDYEKDIKLHDQLIGPPFHASPFEHCARAMNTLEYRNFTKTTPFPDENGCTEVEGWCNNFRGFIQYRYMIENNIQI